MQAPSLLKAPPPARNAQPTPMLLVAATLALLAPTEVSHEDALEDSASNANRGPSLTSTRRGTSAALSGQASSPRREQPNALPVLLVRAPQERIGLCKLCPGSASLGGAASSVRRALRTLSLVAGSTGAKNAGGEESGAGSASCGKSKCDAGSYHDQVKNVCVKCSPGTTPSRRQGVSELPSRHYLSEGATICTVCPRGKFSAEPGLSQCVECKPGQYQNSLGQTTCIPCAQNKYSMETGAKTCTACDAGKSTGDTTGQTRCSDCDAGFYGSGGSSCQACPSGTYSASKGASACNFCRKASMDPRQVPHRASSALQARPTPQQHLRARVFHLLAWGTRARPGSGLHALPFWHYQPDYGTTSCRCLRGLCPEYRPVLVYPQRLTTTSPSATQRRAPCPDKTYCAAGSCKECSRCLWYGVQRQ